jgi:hypothetical protein
MNQCSTYTVDKKMTSTVTIFESLWLILLCIYEVGSVNVCLEGGEEGGGEGPEGEVVHVRLGNPKQAL